LRNVYLERYAYPLILLEKKPSEHLSLIVTIPSYNEKSLIPCLQSLSQCNLPREGKVEVIALINESEDESEDISDTNRACYLEALEWVKNNHNSGLSFYVFYEKLPAKHAGVGLARKVLMDEAVRRFEKVGNPDGVISCYDADCACDSNYLLEIHSFFKENNCAGASIYFEHPLEGEHDDDIYEGIIHYELYLRYYANVLRYSLYPHHHQTIGSSMAVRSDIYQKTGGMNRRKAGEDFYFLHKVMPMGKFGEINTTRVIPSPRPSERVPFGTGKAINKWLTEHETKTYSFKIFEDLRSFLKVTPNIFNQKKLSFQDYPASVNSYLISINAEKEISSILKRSNDIETFEKHFYQWFDGLKVLKYVHHSRDNFYKSKPLLNEVRKLAENLYNEAWEGEEKNLLIKLRAKDKGTT